MIRAWMSVALPAVLLLVAWSPVTATAQSSHMRHRGLGRHAHHRAQVRIRHIERAKRFVRLAREVARTHRARAAGAQSLRAAAAAEWRAANAGLYRCRAPQPGIATPPALPRGPDGRRPTPSDFVQPPRLCAAGQIVDVKTPKGIQAVAPPYPSPVGYPGRALSRAGIRSAGSPVGAGIARVGQRQRALSGPLARAANTTCTQGFGYYYCWAVGSQTISWQDGSGNYDVMMSESSPTLDPHDSYAHTLAQLWGIDYTPGYPGSTQEFGWIRAPQFANGVTTMFVYHFDGNAPTAYNQAGGWVAYPGAQIQPGLPVWNFNQFNTYDVRYSAGNWWFYYDNTPIGYIPGSAYPRYLNTGFLRVDAGGEVASSNATPCSAMGSGWRADIAPDANNAATINWGQRDYHHAGPMRYVQYSPLASYYPLGFWQGGPPNTYFRYGGPGFHAC
jgi:Neprosin